MTDPGDEQERGGLLARRVDLTSMPAGDRLPERDLAVLHEAAAITRLGSPEKQSGGGSGATVVFSGAGCEAKLRAAAALAHETERSLYRVSAPAIVSKYIGETEKNLDRVFQQVQRNVQDSGAILFFDEADSLFGKRSEVKDSHDRYANLSPDAFLKARAAFSGTVILDAESQPTAEEGGPSRLGYEVRFPLSGEV
jgi:ATPase family associated with various cellular activities (AAA)